MKGRILISFLGLCFVLSTKAQIKLDDPLTLIKSPNGKILSREDLAKLMDEGKNFTMSSTRKGDTTILQIRFVSEEESKSKQMLKDSSRLVLLNTTFPNFELEEITGSMVTRGSLIGKVTVLNFWFIECKPCIREIPALNRLVDKYGGEINFIALALDSKDKIDGFLEQKVFNYRILINAGSLPQALGFNSFPTHVILDRKGIIRDVIFGASEDIENRLDKVIRSLR